jgi:hypothetical protein
MGFISTALGMVITRDRSRNVLSIALPTYVKKIVKRFLAPGHVAMSGAKTPVKTDATWHHNVEGPDALPLTAQDTTLYRSLVSSVMYLVGCGRADVSFAAHAAARVMHAPLKIHWKQALRIVSYLHRTSEAGLYFSGTNLNLCLWVDASFADEPQSVTGIDSKKSITGYAFVMNNAVVSHKSKTQSVIATSTQMAEVIAAASGAAEGVHLLHICYELGLPQKCLPLMEDNNACISYVENPIITDATKHIQVKYHYVRECVLTGQIKMQRVSSADQHADVLTKPLAEEPFLRHVKFLLGMAAY